MIGENALLHSVGVLTIPRARRSIFERRIITGVKEIALFGKQGFKRFAYRELKGIKEVDNKVFGFFGIIGKIYYRINEKNKIRDE